jgi:hypothetical protein
LIRSGRWRCVAETMRTSTRTGVWVPSGSKVPLLQNAQFSSVGSPPFADLGKTRPKPSRGWGPPVIGKEILHHDVYTAAADPTYRALP